MKPVLSLSKGIRQGAPTNPDGRHEYLLAFSCKGKWFSPSCHSKKTIQFGEDVPVNILYPVPHRQFVFSIPIMLRIYFKYDRKLLTQLCHCVNESPRMFLRTVLGLADGLLGMTEVTVLDVSDHQPRRVPSKTWRELIKKIWEVDPLSCPRCGYEMKIISLIHEPEVIAHPPPSGLVETASRPSGGKNQSA